jgi:hypothetical protein
MKAYVLADVENNWAGFLYDKDCQSEIVQRRIAVMRSAVTPVRVECQMLCLLQCRHALPQ